MNTFLFFMAALFISASAWAVRDGCRISDSKFKSEAGGCLQVATGRIWSHAPETNHGGAEAESYCRELRQGNKADWRLPTEEELNGVSGRENAYRYFDFSSLRFFWTNESKKFDSARILLATGERVRGPGSPAQVATLCVRTSCRADDSFFESVAGGCRDKKSGLTWNQETVKDVSWLTAEERCRKLEAGVGLTWRLPRWYELRSLATRKPCSRFSADCEKSFLSTDATMDQKHWTVSLKTGFGLRVEDDQLFAGICVSGRSEIPDDATPFEREAPRKLLLGPERGSFSALAYSEATRQFGVIWNYPNQESAGAAAIENCKTAEVFSGAKLVNESRCQLQLSEKDACIAVAEDTRKSIVWATSVDERDAQFQAEIHCLRRFSDRGCRVVRTVCSGSARRSFLNQSR